MIIYGALLIPIITAFVLYRFFSHKTVWWEFLLPLAVSLVLTVSAKLIIEVSQVTSKEYWGSLIDRVEYYEEWNEYIHQTCTRTCCCDDKGQNCGTETYDCSYVETHPAERYIITTTGETVSIGADEYEAIKNRFGNEQFVELNRNYYTDDGDEYFATWKKDSVNAIPVTTIHSYENRIKAADQSVFHFGTVTDDDIKKYTLKDYPKIIGSYTMASVIGDYASDALLADKKISYLNGLLGSKKEVRIFVLIFKNQPVEAAFYQEWYWSGGNMNEFVVCIGVDKNRNVSWCKTISWTISEQLKAEVKDYVQSKPTLKLALQLLPSYLQTHIDKEFQRRDFKEFDYLTVEPPMWAIILTYIITILFNIGLSIWIINNEFEE